jgi:hypothetical protein
MSSSPEGSLSPFEAWPGRRDVEAFMGDKSRKPRGLYTIPHICPTGTLASTFPKTLHLPEKPMHYETE